MRRMFFILGILSITAYAEENDDVRMTRSKESEIKERRVDLAAISSQDESIKKLTALLNREYKGKSQEPQFLHRLADMYFQKAALLFRLAHGRSQSKGAKVDMAQTYAAHKDVISTVTRLETAFPKYANLGSAFFLKAKAYQERGEKKQAASTYLRLVSSFPNHPDCNRAYMALSEFATEDNNHRKSLEYLSHIVQTPKDPLFPFALYKMAWNHYNLAEFKKAIDKLSMQVEYYRDLQQDVENPILEATLLDVALFTVDALEKNTVEFSVKNVRHKFKELGGERYYPQMSLHFAKLLRSRTLQDDLKYWADESAEKDPEIPETQLVQVTYFEDKLNRRQYKNLPEIAEKIVELVKAHPGSLKESALAEVHRILGDSTTRIQNLILKNSKVAEYQVLQTPLARLYQAYVLFLGPEDPRVTKIYFNLAETEFTIGEHEKSVEHYRWVVENGSRSDETSEKFISESFIKAIAARYEGLRKEGVIPVELQAKKLQTEERKLASLGNPRFSQFLEWLDEAKERKLSATANFEFEAARALYQLGFQHESIRRLHKIAGAGAQSQFAQPAVSLILDTYVESEDWISIVEITAKYGAWDDWKDVKFRERLSTLGADAHYKVLDQKVKEGDPNEINKIAKEFLAARKNDKRSAHVSMMLAESALTLGNVDEAVDTLTTQINANSSSAQSAGALLKRATIYEDAFDFIKAVKDYKNLLQISAANTQEMGDKLSAVRKRLLWLTWVAQDLTSLSDFVRADSSVWGICKQDASECQFYQAALDARESANGITEAQAKAAFSNARKSEGKTRTFYAATALAGVEHIKSFTDRNLLIKKAASGLKELDLATSLWIMPVLAPRIRHALEINLKSISSMSPLKADEKSIIRRTEYIQEFEGAAGSLVKSQRSDLQVLGLEFSGLAYLSFAKEISQIEIPQGTPESEAQEFREVLRKIELPFVEKASTILQQAHEAALTFARPDAEISQIAAYLDTLAERKPAEQNKEKSKEEKSAAAPPLGLGQLRVWRQNPVWSMLEDTPYYQNWKTAVKKKQLPTAVFLTEIAREKEIIDEASMHLLLAAALGENNLRSEALERLRLAREELSKSDAGEITRTLWLEAVHRGFKKAAQAEYDRLPDTLKNASQ